MELSKSDVKKVKAIIQKGLMQEFTKGLNKADKILMQWQQGKGDARDTYHALYKHITQFDKGIARRYDGMRNSDVVFVLIQQLDENLVSQNDLLELSQEGQAFVQGILNLREH